MVMFPNIFRDFQKKNDCFKGHAKHKYSGPVVFSPKNLAKKKKSFWVQLFILTKKFRLVCNVFPKTTFFFLFSGFTNAPHCYVSQYFFGTFKKKNDCFNGMRNRTIQQHVRIWIAKFQRLSRFFKWAAIRRP